MELSFGTKTFGGVLGVGVSTTSENVRGRNIPLITKD